MDFSQTVGGLTAGDTMLLMFDHANRMNSSSGAFEVYWNGALVATVSQTGTTMNTASLELVAAAGNNIVRFRGIGAEDNGGASLDNVRLFATEATSSGSGDDDLTGGAGDDVLVGGAGNDTARFSGSSLAYSVTETGDGGYVITDSVAGRDGTDTLTGIETLHFADGDFSPAARIDHWAGSPASVAENATGGSVVGTVAAAGAAGFTGTIVYSLLGDADGRFAIDPATGVVTYTGSVPLNAEIGSYSLQVAIEFVGIATRSVPLPVAIENANLAPTDLLFDTGTALAPTLLGSAQLNAGTYQLTPNSGGQVGVLWNAIDLSHDVTWTARMYFGGSDGGADGISFALQNAGRYVSGANGALTAGSLGIAFDTYSNSGEPSSDFSMFVLNGQYSTSFDTYHSHSNLEDGAWHNVVIDWDAQDQTISYSIDGTSIASKTYDLATLFGGSLTGFFGFGAATGGAYNEQRVDIVSVRTMAARLVVTEDAAAGTLVATLVGVDPDSTDVLSYAITDASGALLANANFEIANGNELRVKAGANIDFESAASLNLFVKVTDLAGLNRVVPVTVDVRNLVEGNEAPTALVLSVLESSPSVLVGSVSQTGADTYRLTPNQNSQNGAVWGNVDLAKDVTWTTRMYFGGNDGGADGINFSLQNEGTGSTGSGALTANSLGIRFDTYSNSGEPASDFSQFVLNGVSSTQFDAFHAHSNLENGAWHDVVISWDAQSQTLRYSVDGADIASRHYDVANLVFGGGTSGYYGFGATTGGASNEQSVQIISVASTASRLSVDDAASANTLVARLTGMDPNVGDALSYAITDASGNPVVDGNFEIVNGNELQVRAGASLTGLGGSTVDLFVRVSDPSAASLVSVVHIDVTGSSLQGQQSLARIATPVESLASLPDLPDTVASIFDTPLHSWFGGSGHEWLWREYDTPLARVPIASPTDPLAPGLQSDVTQRDAARFAESVAAFMPTSAGIFGTPDQDINVGADILVTPKSSGSVASAFAN